MAKKRGLSADEKKQKMLNAMLAGVFLQSFVESSRNLYIIWRRLRKLQRTKEFVICILAGWIVATMIVKDVIQDMLDDDMIIQEKVGTQVLYWIFPSQSYILVCEFSFTWL